MRAHARPTRILRLAVGAAVVVVLLRGAEAVQQGGKMPRSEVTRWLRVALRRAIRVLGSVGRPWTDLAAVKSTQVDVVKAVASQRSEVANAAASIRDLHDQLARLSARNAEQEQAIRELRASVERLRGGGEG